MAQSSNNILKEEVRLRTMREGRGGQEGRSCIVQEVSERVRTEEGRKEGRG